MLSCHFEFTQKDIGIPQVAVCSSFCCTVAKFLSNEQALHKDTCCITIITAITEGIVNIYNAFQWSI